MIGSLPPDLLLSVDLRKMQWPFCVISKPPESEPWCQTLYSSKFNIEAYLILSDSDTQAKHLFNMIFRSLHNSAWPPSARRTLAGGTLGYRQPSVHALKVSPSPQLAPEFSCLCIYDCTKIYNFIELLLNTQCA